jgi:hypothetical protein
MVITTEEAERIAAHLHKYWGLDGVAVMIRSLAAERDALMEWRTAIYDALTEWHDPPRDDETPKAALRRLVHTEILAVLDPAVSRPAADLVAKARRDALEEAAKVAKDYALKLEDMAELSPYPHVKREHEGRSWVAQTIAAAIRALAKGKGDD